MSPGEFDEWTEFYQAQPFDDFHRYHRPAALVSASRGADLDAALNWLQPKPDDGRTRADRDIFEAAGAIPPPRTSR